MHCAWRTNPCSAEEDGGEGKRERDADAHRRALYDIMTCMRDVRKRAEVTDGMFDPLREAVQSLQGVGVALPDGVLRQVRRGGWVGAVSIGLGRGSALHPLLYIFHHNLMECMTSAALWTCSDPAIAFSSTPQLETAEVRWKGLKKKVLNRREALAALQQAEAVDVRRKSDAFNERVEEYRK
jgi:hypothetical protein